MSMLFTSQWTGDDALPLRWGLVAGSYSQIHVLLPVIIFKKNSGSLLSLSGMSWHVLTWISFCSSTSRQGTSLVAITYIFILSFKILWRVPNKFQTHSELHRQKFSYFLKTSSTTQSTYSSILLINGHPKCSASSTLLLNFKNHSKTSVLSTPCSSKTTSNILKFPVLFLPVYPTI